MEQGILPVDEKLAFEALENLKKFQSDQTLKAAAFSYIASQLLSKKEKDNLAISFRAFDKNADGLLTLNEIKQAFVDLKRDFD